MRTWIQRLHSVAREWVNTGALTSGRLAGPSRKIGMSSISSNSPAGESSASTSGSFGPSPYGAAESSVVTAVAETEVAIDAVVAVRDKVIAAYEEIMKMPI